MNRILPIAFVVAVIAAGAYFLMGDNVQNVEVAEEQPVVAASEQTTEPESDTAVESTEATTEPEATAETASPDSVEIQDMVLGDPNAPITMVEYASYTCPHCGSFHQNTYPQLKADYIDTGKVKFIFREVYFDRFGLWASMVARCGGQERFFGITDLMFKTQAAWTRAGDAPAIVEELRKIARLAGLTEGELDACMQDEAQAQALVAWFQANAERDDISATPSFVINGTKHSNMGYDDLKALLDGLL